MAEQKTDLGTQVYALEQAYHAKVDRCIVISRLLHECQSVLMGLAIAMPDIPGNPGTESVINPLIAKIEEAFRK